MTNNKAHAMSLRASQMEETLIEIYSMLTEPEKMSQLSYVAKMIADCATIAENMSVELSGTRLTLPISHNVVSFNAHA
jgi:hypothetical protein